MKRVSNTDKVIGARLRALRVAKGLSQTDVATELGITFQQIQKYEKGINRVASARLQALTKLFGITMSELFEQPEASANGSGIPDESINTHQLARMVKAFKTLTNSQRRAVANLIKSMSTEE